MHVTKRELDCTRPVYADDLFGGSPDTFFYRRYVKRMLDVFVVLLALPIVLPILGLLAFLIRRDGGPAFYHQDRVGRKGRTFRLWKLRSMVVDADAELEAYLAANSAGASGVGPHPEAQERSPNHAGRPVHPQELARRVAAALERPEG